MIDEPPSSRTPDTTSSGWSFLPESPTKVMSNVVVLGATTGSPFAFRMGSPKASYCCSQTGVTNTSAAPTSVISGV